MDAAIQIGKDEYPPIPNTIEGLFNNSKVKELIIENEIVAIDNKNFTKFFFIKGDAGIFIKFKCS